VVDRVDVLSVKLGKYSEVRRTGICLDPIELHPILGFRCLSR